MVAGCLSLPRLPAASGPGPDKARGSGYDFLVPNSMLPGGSCRPLWQHGQHGVGPPGPVHGLAFCQDDHCLQLKQR